MCWDEHHDDDVDALTNLVFWNPDRGDKGNMTGYDNKRLDGRNKKNSTVLLYVYTSTPPQQYQYVPKETVRHQKGIYDVLKNNLYLLEGLEFTPPSSVGTKRDIYVPGTYTNIFFSIFRLMRYTYDFFFFSRAFFSRVEKLFHN